MVPTTLMMVIMMCLCDDDDDIDYDNDDLDEFFDHKNFPMISNYYDLKHNIPTKKYESLHNLSTPF
jgi:hypothetical protein